VFHGGHCDRAPPEGAEHLPGEQDGVQALRAVASADLHNLVFRRDYRIIPAIVNGWAPRQPA